MRLSQAAEPGAQGQQETVTYPIIVRHRYQSGAVAERLVWKRVSFHTIKKRDDVEY